MRRDEARELLEWICSITGQTNVLSLKQAALANGVSEELFDRVVDPIALTRPGSADVPSGPGKG